MIRDLDRSNPFNRDRQKQALHFLELLQPTLTFVSYNFCYVLTPLFFSTYSSRVKITHRLITTKSDINTIPPTTYPAVRKTIAPKRLLSPRDTAQKLSLKSPRRASLQAWGIGMYMDTTNLFVSEATATQ